MLQPARGLELVEHAQQPLGHLHAADRVDWFGASTQMPSSSSRKASSTRRTLSRSAAPTTASIVSWPLPSPSRRPGPVDVEDDQAERMPVALVLSIS